jgi:DNA-binding NarL/FixJ family response regulator
MLAEGHRLVRAGLRAVIGSDEHVCVVAETAEAHETLQRCEAIEPDVLLLDLNLPNSTGLGLATLVSRSGKTRVLLMCDRDSTISVREVLAAGCMGVLRKDVPGHDVLDALRCVHAGRLYLDEDMARQFTQPAPEPPTSPLDRLSPRECEVFHLIAAGHTNRSAGRQLGLSPKTVEKHRAAVMSKLRLGNALELRLLALDLTSGGKATPSGAAVFPDLTPTGVALGGHPRAQMRLVRDANAA